MGRQLSQFNRLWRCRGECARLLINRRSSTELCRWRSGRILSPRPRSSDGYRDGAAGNLGAKDGTGVGATRDNIADEPFRDALAGRISATHPLQGRSRWPRRCSRRVPKPDRLRRVQRRYPATQLEYVAHLRAASGSTAADFNQSTTARATFLQSPDF